MSTTIWIIIIGLALIRLLYEFDFFYWLVRGYKGTKKVVKTIKKP